MADEISREALLIYLDDVRTMETIVYESENALKNAQDEMVRTKYKNENIGSVNRVENSAPAKPDRPIPPDDGLGCSFGCIGIGLFILLTFLIPDLEGWMKLLIFVSSVAWLIIGFRCLLSVLSDKKEYNEAMPKYRAVFSDYEEKREKYESELREAQSRYDEGMQQILTKAKDRRGRLNRRHSIHKRTT